MRTRPAASSQGRSHIPSLALAIVLLVATAACGGSDGATGNPLEGSRWEMTSVRDGSTLVAANPVSMTTLQFTDSEAFGSAGCNRYQFPYSVKSDSLSFGHPAQTGAACDQGHLGQSDAYFHAMEATERFVLSADSLELTDAAGATQVVFRPASELPLTWVDWQLIWYGGGTSPLEGTQISVAFRGDGTLTGTAGCNSYSADYEIDKDQLVIGALARTEMACANPDGVMTQETDYLKALNRAAGFTTTLTSLELLDGDGHPLAEYRFGGRIRDDLLSTSKGDH